MPGGYAFIERSSLTTFLTERLTTEGYLQLIPRRLGDHRATIVGRKYFKLWQDRIENTVSINRITEEPRANDSENDDIANEE